MFRHLRRRSSDPAPDPEPTEEPAFTFAQPEGPAFASDAAIVDHGPDGVDVEGTHTHPASMEIAVAFLTNDAEPAILVSARIERPMVLVPGCRVSMAYSATQIDVFIKGLRDAQRIVLEKGPAPEARA